MTPGEEELLHAGTITGAHGVRGWVKVHAFTDPVDNFLDFDTWYARRRGHFDEVEFLEARRHGKGLVARLAGVDDRDAAEKLRGVEVWVRRGDLPPLAAGEYYWHELLGMRVYSEHDARPVLLGEVDHLMETGANDVIVLRPCKGSVDDRERLLPWLPGQVVKEIDRGAGRISVDWHPDD